jgi:transposase-like protein
MKAKGAGDVWTWTAFDAETKLMPGSFVGQRDAGCAYHFIHDSKARLANRAQLTTDGHRAYLKAVEDTFGAEMDYAILQKIYGTLENHEPALVFYFMYYNFCRIHQTLWWWHTFKCTTT